MNGRSAKHNDILQLGRLLADRNRRLKQAVKNGDHQVAELAAQDVADMADLLIRRV